MDPAEEEGFQDKIKRLKDAQKKEAKDDKESGQKGVMHSAGDLQSTSPGF